MYKVWLVNFHRYLGDIYNGIYGAMKVAEATGFECSVIDVTTNRVVKLYSPIGGWRSV